jgi:hypothetical protein
MLSTIRCPASSAATKWHGRETEDVQSAMMSAERATPASSHAAALFAAALAPPAASNSTALTVCMSA